MERELRPVPAEITPRQLPTLNFDESLSNVPYEVNFDLNRFVSFMEQNFPVKRDQISCLTINIERGYDKDFVPNRTLGLYKNQKHELFLYADAIYSVYEENLERTRRVLDGELEAKKAHFPYVRSKRYKSYLDNAPKERAMEYSERFLLGSANNFANETIIHEAKHAMESKRLWKLNAVEKYIRFFTPPFVFTAAGVVGSLDDGATWILVNGFAGSAMGYLTTGAINLLGGYHSVDSMEIRARRFEKKHHKDLHGDRILTFTPKA